MDASRFPIPRPKEATMVVFVVSTFGETAVVPVEDLPPVSREAHDRAFARWSKRLISEWNAMVSAAF